MDTMFFIALILVYLGLNFFIWKKAAAWFRSLHSKLNNKWFTVVFTVLHFLIAMSPAAYALFQNHTLRAAIKQAGNVWIGIFIYTLLFMTISACFTLILRTLKKGNKAAAGQRSFIAIRGAVVLLLIVGFSAYGTFHVGSIKTTAYDVTVHKTCAAGKKLKIVLAADMHMGYSVGVNQMERMAEKINEQNADIVCFAGDIFDNDYDALQDPDRLLRIYRSIKSKYGIYACYGNHDVKENLLGGFTVPSSKVPYNQVRMGAFLKAAGIKLLQDQSESVDSAFYVVGRRDYTKPGTENGTRKSIEELTSDLDRTKPIILIEHQPKELKRNADAGVDLALSGHTHDGQIFPGNLTIRLLWENACGYLKKGGMHSIVTSGVGIWGPAMRVGTDSEITVINVEFH